MSRCQPSRHCAIRSRRARSAHDGHLLAKRRAARQVDQLGRTSHPIHLPHRLATREYGGDDRHRAYGLLAMAYQAAAVTLPKVGEQDLAWIASDRGLAAAERSGDPVIIGSLFRSVTHSLLSVGQYAAAVRMTEQAADYLRDELVSCAGNSLDKS